MFFVCQTVSKLALVAGGTTLVGKEDDPVYHRGRLDYLPAQQRILQNADGSNSTQHLFLSIPKTLTHTQLTAVVAALTTRHDVLRLQFHTHNGHWEQQYTTSQPLVLVETLTDGESGAANNDLENIVGKHKSKIDVENGLPCAFVLIETPPSGESNSLLVLIHSLVIDQHSWQILLNDLTALFDAAIDGEGTDLPGNKKTGSYRQWTHAVQKYGERASVKTAN